jgi:hypothetical protein
VRKALSLTRSIAKENREKEKEKVKLNLNDRIIIL